MSLKVGKGRTHDHINDNVIRLRGLALDDSLLRMGFQETVEHGRIASDGEDEPLTLPEIEEEHCSV